VSQAMTKPYPSYRDSGISWLGQVPSHWETLPLFGVLGERQDKNIGLHEKNVLSLSYGQIVRRNIDDNFGLIPESFESYQIVRPGDVIIRPTDLQNDQRSIRVGQAREKGIITSAYMTLYPKSQKIEQGYLGYLLLGFDLMKVFYALGAGVRQSLKFEDIKKLPILVPEPNEQSAIVTYLDRVTARIDTLIAQKRRLLKLLAEKRQALITQAVTRGLDAKVRLKDSGVEWLGQVPEHWVAVSLKWLVSMPITDGPHETP
jgi:type I restriction enzyme S subunit